MNAFDYFPFKVPPFDHQKDYLVEHADDEFYALFWEMGSGKSKAIIDNAAYLYDTGDINTLVIIALKGVYLNWVRREIPIHMPEHIDYHIVEWNNIRGVGWEKQFQAMLDDQDSLCILVLNTESFSSRRPKGVKKLPPPKCFKYLDKVLRTGHIMAVIDESSAIKDPGSSRTKNINRFAKECTYRRILTGTPITQSPFDAFAQTQFLEPGILGYKDYWSFKRRYAEFRTARFGDRTFEEVVKYRNLDELKTKLQVFSSFILKSECLDLPDKLYNTEYVDITVEQKTHYETMRKQLLVDLGNDDIVVVENPLTKLIKLHQILCGFIIDEDQVTHLLNHNRLDALRRVIDRTEGKIIIWTHFRACLKDVGDYLRLEFGANTVVEYHGGTGTHEREEAINKFQDKESSVRFFVANQQTAGYGLTLTQARAEIYYTNNYSLEQRLQSEDRAHRPGQEYNVSITDLIIPDTVDEQVMKALTGKVDIATQVTGLFKGWLK